MSNERSKHVPLDQIRLRFYVRVALDQDRVDIFSKMYKADSTELPPIILGKLKGEDDLILVDGRTRRQAREHAGFKDVSAIVREYDKMSDMIVAAFKANVGGSMPPSQSDIIHTLDRLLDENLSRKAIVEDICAGTGYPPTLIRRYLDDAQAARNKRRLNQAITAMTSGEITLSEAAAKYDVSVTTLRSAIQGKKKQDKPAAQQIVSGISSRYKSHSFKNSALLKSILKRIDEGDFSKKDVEKISKHFHHLIRKETKVVEDGVARLMAKFTAA